MARPFPIHNVTDDSALGGSVIERSLRFNDGDSPYLIRTPSSAGNRQIWTWSSWLKRAEISSRGDFFGVGTSSSANNNDIMGFRFDGSDELCFAMYSSDVLVTTQKFRDSSAWYHIVIASDTTQATSSNRVKMYINGTQVTAFNTANYPSQNFNFAFNGALQTAIGRSNVGANNYFDGYLAEVHLIDGQQLTPSNFGYTDDVTGIWRPKKYEGTHGTNGCYLDFSDNSATTAVTLGKDRSGNGNDFTPSNFSVSAGEGNDSLLDTPTNNFATMNPLVPTPSATWANGNLDLSGSSSSAYSQANLTTFGVSSGKWYAEVKITYSTTNVYVGVCPITTPGNTNLTGSVTDAAVLRMSNETYIEGASASSGTSISSGDTIGIALDMDNLRVWFSVQGTYINSGNPSTGSNATFDGITAGETMAIAARPLNGTLNFNFGQRPFTYTPPTGFKTLCSNNLLEHNIPAVIRPKKYFDILEWTGNDSSDRDITGLQFKPDFVWIKNKEGPDWPNLQNVVTGANVMMYSNRDDGPATDNGNGHVNSFIEGGFNVDAGGSGNVNENNEDYVAWCWKAGGAAVTNDDGTIQTTISANQESGFSIMKWSGNGSAGSTVGHGLGRKPKLIIVKRFSGGNQSWFIRIASIYGAAAGKYIKLQDPGSVSGVDTNVFPNTEPTSTVFSLGADSGVNASGSTYLCYCWAEIPGYSKFDTYTGNGSTDGSFVYTGFKPRMFIFKRLTGGNSGYVPVDTSRAPINPSNIRIELNGSAAQDSNSAYNIDILSNGFKSRNSNSEFNASNEYVVWAWADTPGNTPFGTEPSAK